MYISNYTKKIKYKNLVKNIMEEYNISELEAIEYVDENYKEETILKTGNKEILCGIPYENILKQINKKYLFETICKIRNIEYEEIIAKLIIRIMDSEICDKDIYVSQQEIWDSEYIRVIRDEYRLHICDDLLFNRKEALEFFKNDLNNNFNSLDELWIETTEEEKEIIEIAKELNLGEIGVEIL